MCKEEDVDQENLGLGSEYDIVWNSQKPVKYS